MVKKALLERADAGQSAFKAALDKGIFRVYKKEINRFASMGNARADLPTLSDEQRRAFHEILDSFRQHAVTLLHGVTSSGKTAVYMHLIAEALRLRKQVLDKFPEAFIIAFRTGAKMNVNEAIREVKNNRTK